MGCACNKNRALAAAARQGITYVYDYTAPGATEPITLGTAIEGKREVRKNGGGRLVRREVSTTPAA